MQGLGRGEGARGARRGHAVAAACLAALAALAVGAAVALGRVGRLERADFVFASGSASASLDPQATTTDPQGRVLRALYEGLVAHDPLSLELLPAAAASWEISPDGLEYVFHLQPEGRWSNGDALGAQDFEWSLRRVLEPETASVHARKLWCIEGARELSTGRDESGAPVPRAGSRLGIEALDALTLRLRLAHPAPELLHLLAFPAFFPVHRPSLEVLQQRFPDRWRTEWTRPRNLVVNGPFTLELRRAGDRLRLRKNPLYWDADAVAFDSIDVLDLEQGGTALNLFLAGEIDWLDGAIPPLLLPRLAQREDFRREPYLGICWLLVNVTRPPLDDPRVRRALALTLPRRQICGLSLEPGQEPATTIVPWGRLGGYRSPQLLSEGGDEARRLLREAGWGAGGQPFPGIDIVCHGSEPLRRIAELAAAAWRLELGIEVRLRSQEREDRLDPQSTLACDLACSSWTADHPEPLGLLRTFERGNENSDATGWSSRAFDRLVEAAAREHDPGRRNGLLVMAEQQLLTELPVIPVCSYASQKLVNRRLGGFGSNVLDEHDPKHWFWKDDRMLLRERQVRGGRQTPVRAFGPVQGKFSPRQQRQLEQRRVQPPVAPQPEEAR